MKQLRSYLLATASSVALAATASAADMPVKAQPAPPVAPVLWSWAGPYAGLNLGVAWNHSSFSDLLTPGATTYAFPLGANDPFWTPTKAGFTFGGQAGYNWQSGNLVYGVEGDLSWVADKASATFAPFGVPLGATSKLDFMATVRGRLGVSFSQYLLYATGGAAFAHFSDSWGVVSIGAQEFTSNQMRAGWTAGGGIEYMIAPNWTARVEALYADFGTKSVTTFIPGAGPYTSDFRHTVTTARAALNWKW